MAGLIKAHLILMIITFIELSIFLSIMRVRNSVIIAAFISLIDILPVLGTGTVLYPWGIISMISGNSALGISLIIAQLIMTIIRNIIEPRIIGTHTGLNPILTLASIYIGTKLFGFIGMYVFMLIIIMAVKYRNSASNN